MAKKTLTTEQKLLIYPRVEDFLWSNETLDDNDGSEENRSIEVSQMQECLVVLGFPLPLFGVDGIFRNETKTALKAYQEASFLKPDGICGENTNNQFYIDIVPPPGAKSIQVVEDERKTELIEQAVANPNSQQNLTKTAFDYSKFKPYFLVLLNLLLIQALKFDFTSTDIFGRLFKKFDNGCPTPPELGSIIRKRNNVAKALNNVGKFIEGFNKTTQTLTGSLNTFSQILQAGRAVLDRTNQAMLVAIASGIGIPFVLPPGNKLIDNLKDILYERKNSKDQPRNVQSLTNQALKVSSQLSFAVGIVNAIIIKNLIKLKSLDALIQNCSEQQVDLEQISSFINSISNDELEDIQQGTEGNYKNFTFEIKEEEGQNFQSYPKRYAVAIDVNGVIVLESERSFTSTPQVLIEELKFIIDRDDLKSE